MKILKLALVLAAMLVVASGCSAIARPEPEDGRSAYERIHEKLVNLRTYRAEATVEYISNRGSNVYETLQQANFDGRYRIEVTGPDNVAGNITVFDGQTISQFNPRVSGRVAMSVRENPERSEIFLTSFTRNFLGSKEVSVSVASFGQGNFTVLETAVPGNHPYMASQRLWVDNQALHPVRLVIYDKDGTERVIVNFKTFEYNIDLDDDIFNVS
ncbi:MAG: outer-membrane lipoprotein carrier protein LolA [Defluviitaleaceae bacterium]|nr:outer-membrane lipoprotein carrier protein LolA [Defluviitaleaceae bacterium]